jgi:hypothetical protein
MYGWRLAASGDYFFCALHAALRWPLIARNSLQLRHIDAI